MGKRYLFIVLAFIITSSGFSIEAMAAEIEGAFGYKFGGTVPVSNLIDRYESAYPAFLESYHVKPSLENDDLDSYSATMCRSFNAIVNLSGFRLFDDREEAMVFLKKYKRGLENKYGRFNRPPMGVNNDVYKETLIKNGASVSVLVLNKSMNPPQWAFMIMYDNIRLTRQCGIPIQP